VRLGYGVGSAQKLVPLFGALRPASRPTLFHVPLVKIHSTNGLFQAATKRRNAGRHAYTVTMPLVI
jgi:hypothetical protein